MKILLEQGFGILGIAALTGICILVRLSLFIFYTGLSKACGNFWKSKHKALVYIKKDLKQRADEHQKIKNSMVYTECRLAECKVGIVRLGTLEGMMQQSVLLVPLCGIMIAFAGVLTGCGHREIFSVLFVSGAAVVLLLFLDLCGGVKEKHRRIRLGIRDAIENSRERTEEMPEVCVTDVSSKKEKRKEKRTEKRNECKERKESKKENRNSKRKQITSGNRKQGKAQEEKRRLTEELLRERRQMEARSLAELRKREQKEETELQQVCAEAAVTEQPAVHVMPERKKEENAESIVPQEFTYETLLSEVLAEYLA